MQPRSMQPGSIQCFPHPSLKGHIIFSVKYNFEPQSHLLLFFLSKLAFTAFSNRSTVAAAKSCSAFKNLYSKIFSRYAAAIH